jgi:hypothetical protein
VRQVGGSKKVMLKNVAKAKFETCWIPIVARTISRSQQNHVSFKTYFNLILMHEVAHGLGPGIFEKNSRNTTVGAELKELYPIIEETKADITGLWSLAFLIKKGVIPNVSVDEMYNCYLGGIFRSVRFGADSAHGGGNAIQLNYLMEKGGIIFNDKTRRFSMNRRKIRDSVRELCHDILMIEALGDYQRASEFISKYRQISLPLETVLHSLTDIPIDIKPIYSFEHPNFK